MSMVLQIPGWFSLNQDEGAVWRRPVLPGTGKIFKAQDCSVTVTVGVHLRCDLQQVLGPHFTPFVKWG